jgi:Fe-S cluster assembly protein SufD
MSIQLPIAGAIGAAAVETRRAGGPAWLGERRRAAWEAFTELPMPSPQRDEDWRRTDVSGLRLEEYIADPGGTASGETLLQAMQQLRLRAAPQAAFVASTRRGLRRREGTEMLDAQGVIVCSLDDAAVQHPEQLRRALSTVPPEESKFLALWNALWRGGCFVYVPPGVEARVPVWAAHTAAGAGAASFPATVAVLGDGASLTLIDVYASPAGDDDMVSVAASPLVLGDGARLDYCLLQQWGMGTWHVALHRASAGRDARLRFFGASLGARLQKAYWEVLLDGQGAEATLTGICFGDGTQHLDHQSLQDHRAPQTRSDLLLKVAVRDEARSVYGGLIEVQRRAQQSDGYVQNRNLMLSRGARASGIPRLEIKADDVRCSHGVTAGHIDNDQRFYLESRGVPRAEADRLIVRGFMQDALDRCPHQGVRELLADLLDEETAGHAVAGVSSDENPA